MSWGCNTEKKMSAIIIKLCHVFSQSFFFFGHLSPTIVGCGAQFPQGSFAPFIPSIVRRRSYLLESREIASISLYRGVFLLILTSCFIIPYKDGGENTNKSRYHHQNAMLLTTRSHFFHSVCCICCHLSQD